MAREIKVLSDLGGVVWAVEVSPGQAVNEGDTLIVLESMKMEIPIAAPCAGTVAQILVESSQIVDEGQLVARLER